MDITIKNQELLAEAAKTFVQGMGDAKIFAFYGKMGSGKTTFIKAICRQLGVQEVITSPTFSLVNEYTAENIGKQIFHFDFYRIKKLSEVYDMGYEEYFYGDQICFIEWPELIEEILPEETVRVSITVQPDESRMVHID